MLQCRKSILSADYLHHCTQPLLCQCLHAISRLLCAYWVAERCFSTVVYPLGQMQYFGHPKERHGYTQCILAPCRFVELVEELAHQGIIQRLGIVPVMCASATTPYALAVVARLQAAVPNCIIHTQFLGPKELAQVRQGPCMPDLSACCISTHKLQAGAHLEDCRDSRTEALLATLSCVVLAQMLQVS